MSRFILFMGLSFMALSFMIFGLWAPVAEAHSNTSLAYSDISYDHGVIRYKLQIDLYDLRAEATPNDPDIGLQTPEALNTFFVEDQPEVEALLRAQIKLLGDGLPLNGKLAQLHRIDRQGEVQPFAEAVMEYPIGHAPKQFALDYNLVFDSDQWHVNYVNIALGPLKQTGVIVSELHSLQAGRMSLSYTIQRFLLLGLERLFTGFAAILFVVALIVQSQSLKRTLAAVAAFAAAHSLTLILASLQVVVLPDRFVNVVSAFSIVYIVLHTLLFRNDKLLLWLAAACGLIHGFRFAEALSGMSVDDGHVAASLVSFTMGIEVGLALVVLVGYPAVHYVRRYKRGIPFILTTIALVGLVDFLVTASR